MTTPFRKFVEVSSGATIEELRMIGKLNRNFVDHGPKFNHAGHLFLTIFTMGLWLPVYALTYHFSDRAKWYRKHNATQLMNARVLINREKV